MPAVTDNTELFNEPSSWPPLPDNTPTYRMLLKPTCITPEGNVTSLAFLLRPADNGCLSVALRGSRTETEVFQEEPTRFNRCVGISKNSVGELKSPIPQHDTLLEVVQDKIYHACVFGLPPPPELTSPDYEQQKIDAEYVANELAKRARLVWRKP